MKTSEQIHAEIQAIYTKIQSLQTVINYEVLKLKELADSVVAAKVQTVAEEKKADAS